MSNSQPLSSSGKSNKKIQHLVWLCLLLWVCLFGIRYATPARAQTEEIQLEIVPVEIEIIPGRQTEVQVTIRNLTDRKIQNTQLSYFTETDIKIDINAPENPSLEPQSALTWILRVYQVGNERISGVVHLRVDYSWKPEQSESLVPGVAYQSLDIKTQVPEAIKVLPEVELKTVLTKLVEGQPGIVYVVVNNKSNLPIQIRNIELDGPDFIRFSPIPQNFDAIIETNESQVFQYTVETDQSVTPGKYLLLFKVDFTWKFQGHEWPGAVIETHEIDVSVFGESGIMSVLGLATLGIPTFLILPGFLMIVTIGVLWRWIPPKTGGFIFNNLVESLKMPEFHLWIITLSFLMIWIYRQGSEYLKVPRDLLKGYGFVDVVAVWFTSILLAIAVFFLYTIIKILVQRTQKIYNDWKCQQLIPSSHDTPIEILEKLNRQNLGVLRERVVVTINGQILESPAYLLQAISEGKEDYWVAPRIKVLWKHIRTEEENEILKAVQNQFTVEGNDAGILASKLSKALRQKTISVMWEPTEPINMKSPLLVKKADIQLPPLAANSIVTMELL